MTTLIADPRVAGIAVHDNAEPVVDLASCGVACASTSKARRSGRLVRQGVAERLVAADAALPPGVRLFVLEALRSPQSQQDIFASYSRKLRAELPGVGEDELLRLVSRYVAPLAVAPHVAGAAVDITLVDGDGRRLGMGAAVDATPEESRNSIAFDADVSDEARSHRTLLADALGSAGLVNYPTEWWHWSYGDRYWAHVTGAEHACYGPVTR